MLTLLEFFLGVEHDTKSIHRSCIYHYGIINVGVCVSLDTEINEIMRIVSFILVKRKDFVKFLRRNNRQRN